MDDPNPQRNREDNWVEGLSANDPEVFEDLFCTLYEDLVAYAQSIVRREPEAEGLVQEVFLRLWKREGWEPSDNVTAYAYRAVHNRALNAVRDRLPREDDPESHPQRAVQAYVPADRQLHTDQLREAIEQAIDDLPDRRRQIFLMSRRHDLTYAQIAKVLDISERTVETQIRRALQSLRECVAEYE